MSKCAFLIMKQRMFCSRQILKAQFRNLKENTLLLLTSCYKMTLNFDNEDLIITQYASMNSGEFLESGSRINNTCMT